MLESFRRGWLCEMDIIQSSIEFEAIAFVGSYLGDVGFELEFIHRRDSPTSAVYTGISTSFPSLNQRLG